MSSAGRASHAFVPNHAHTHAVCVELIPVLQWRYASCCCWLAVMSVCSALSCFWLDLSGCMHRVVCRGVSFGSCCQRPAVQPYFLALLVNVASGFFTDWFGAPLHDSAAYGKKCALCARR